MARDEDYKEYIMKDILGHIPGLSARAMFSGWGIYSRWQHPSAGQEPQAPTMAGRPPEQEPQAPTRAGRAATDQHRMHGQEAGPSSERSSRPGRAGRAATDQHRMCALIAEGQLYFKVDELNRPDYEEAGSEPFRYRRKGGRIVSLSYWLVPEWVLEDRELVSLWLEKASEAAGRSGSRQGSWPP